MVVITLKEKKDPEEGYQLVISSKDLKALKSLKSQIEDMYMRCENCFGDVTKSGELYLCMSGCGHVKAI